MQRDYIAVERKYVFLSERCYFSRDPRIIKMEYSRPYSRESVGIAATSRYQAGHHTSQCEPGHRKSAWGAATATASSARTSSARRRLRRPPSSSSRPASSLTPCLSAPAPRHCGCAEPSVAIGGAAVSSKYSQGGQSCTSAVRSGEIATEMLRFSVLLLGISVACGPLSGTAVSRAPVRGAFAPFLEHEAAD